MWKVKITLICSVGELDNVQSVQNKSCRVLGGGIELKNNAAYSTDSTSHSQSIGNVTYETVEADPEYDVLVYT